MSCVELVHRMDEWWGAGPTGRIGPTDLLPFPCVLDPAHALPTPVGPPGHNVLSGMGATCGLWPVRNLVGKSLGTNPWSQASSCGAALTSVLGSQVGKNRGTGTPAASQFFPWLQQNFQVRATVLEGMSRHHSLFLQLAGKHPGKTSSVWESAAHWASSHDHGHLDATAGKSPISARVGAKSVG